MPAALGPVFLQVWDQNHTCIRKSLGCKDLSVTQIPELQRILTFSKLFKDSGANKTWKPFIP